MAKIKAWIKAVWDYILHPIVGIMQNDKTALSLARVCSLVSFCVFVFVTLYLVLKGQEWNEYKTLATVSVGYCCVALLNKGVDAWGLKVNGNEEHRPHRM